MYSVGDRLENPPFIMSSVPALNCATKVPVSVMMGSSYLKIIEFYEINGEQYIVLPASGGISLGMLYGDLVEQGDAMVAFKLED